MQKRSITRKDYVGSELSGNEAVVLLLSCNHTFTIYRRVNQHDYDMAKFQIVHPCMECDACKYNKTGEL